MTQPRLDGLKVYAVKDESRGICPTEVVKAGSRHSRDLDGWQPDPLSPSGVIKWRALRRREDQSLGVDGGCV